MFSHAMQDVERVMNTSRLLQGETDMFKATLTVKAFELAKQYSEAVAQVIKDDEELEHLNNITRNRIEDIVFLVLEGELLKINELSLVSQ